MCLISISGAGFDDEKSLLMSQMSLEKRFGQSAVFVASTLMENGGVPQSATPETLLKEAIHVISCGYEDKTDWGSEVMWQFSLELQYCCCNFLDNKFNSHYFGFVSCRLDGSMVRSQKIFSRDSRCTPVGGGQFTACRIHQPSKGLLLSIFQIV